MTKVGQHLFAYALLDKDAGIGVINFVHSYISHLKEWCWSTMYILVWIAESNKLCVVTLKLNVFICCLIRCQVQALDYWNELCMLCARAVEYQWY